MGFENLQFAKQGRAAIPAINRPAARKPEFNQ
jgi:hypothetical protein